MSYANDPMGASLDRHITGNYGEDQYADTCDSYDDEYPGTRCTSGPYERERCPFLGDKADCDREQDDIAAEGLREMERER